jgi:hypothetical protein
MKKTADHSDAYSVHPEVVGIRPWLPWPLSRMRWWTEPVPAERLAVLRIAMSALLLLDVVLVYFPHRAVFFGRDSMGRPENFEWLYTPEWNRAAPRDDLLHLQEDLAKSEPFHRTLERRWRWSLLHGVEDPQIIKAAMAAWIAATVLLLLGLGTRPAAVVVWLLSTSFASVNTYIDNGGDQVRYIVTLYLMLTPCGAVWSLDAWLRRRRGRLTGPVAVYPWALRLLFVQMTVMYWCNGLYKASGHDWWSGESLYYVLNDLTLNRWSYGQFPIPYRLTQALTWTVLIWEVGFPFWMLLPWSKISDRLDRLGLHSRLLLSAVRNVPAIALAFGVLFHLGIWLSMELGFFVPYVLCLYLPLLPFERLSGRWVKK